MAERALPMKNKPLVVCAGCKRKFFRKGTSKYCVLCKGINAATPTDYRPNYKQEY